jgi:hypothetical protein
MGNVQHGRVIAGALLNNETVAQVITCDASGRLYLAPDAGGGLGYKVEFIEADTATLSRNPFPIAGVDGAGAIRSLRTARSVETGSGFSAANGSHVLANVPFLYQDIDQSLQAFRNNREIVLFAPGVRSSNQTSAMQTNHNSKGLVLNIRTTVVTGAGTITVRIYNRVDSANVYGEAILFASSALGSGAVGSFAHLVYPGLTNATVPTGYNSSVNGVLSRTWYCDVTHSNSDPIQYRIGAVELL